MAALLEISTDTLLKDKQLGLIEEEEANQVMDQIEVEKGEHYTTKNRICARSDEEIERYKMEISVEEQKQQDDREVMGREHERNR